VHVLSYSVQAKEQGHHNAATLNEGLQE